MPVSHGTTTARNKAFGAIEVREQGHVVARPLDMTNPQRSLDEGVPARDHGKFISQAEARMLDVLETLAVATPGVPEPAWARDPGLA